MDNELNKSEKATPKQRSRARSQGQIARSPEISSTGTIVAGTIALAWVGPVLGRNMIDFTRGVLASLRHGDVEVPGQEMLLSAPSVNLLVATVAWMGIVALAALTTGYGQAGFDIAGEALTLRWSNLDPIAGMKKLFSWSSLIRSGVTVVKMGVVIFVCQSVIVDAFKSDLFTRECTAVEMIVCLTSFAITLGWRVALAMIVIAISDFAYQKWKYEKNLMMTKEEVKEETKSSEPNPQVRNKIRSIMLARHRKRMMGEVPKATVVVTNPTHVAVAIRYDRRKMKAPKVVAKGLNLIAEKIKNVASSNGVPIIENKPLARGLYRKCNVGSEIPSTYYQAVAVVLAQVYRLAEQRQREALIAEPPPNY